MSSETLSALQTISDDIERVVAEASPSVLSVRGPGNAGTGIAWDERHAVTAYHVVEDYDEVDISVEGRQFSGIVKGHDTASDIALIECSEHLTPIRRDDSDRLRVGQFVLALANPYDGGVGATSGIITGVRKRVGGWWNFSLEEAIVTDARVGPGYSGGPLVNTFGQIVGMNVALVSSRGIAVPVNRIARRVDGILTGKTPGRPYLGVGLSYVRLPESMKQGRNGLLIMSVEKGSPAEAAGLIPGDILLTVGDRNASREFGISNLLAEDAVGKEVMLGILRGGRYIELNAVPSQAQEE